LTAKALRQEARRTGQAAQPQHAASGRAAGAVVLTLVVCLAARGSDEPHATTSCNGSEAACEKPLNEIVFPATHNSYAASDEPGWHFANQRYGIARRLADGIRAFLIDVHFGVQDPARGIVRTDFRAEGADRNKVAKQIGPRALRADQALHEQPLTLNARRRALNVLLAFAR
jgi:hypothetical protein